MKPVWELEVNHHFTSVFINVDHLAANRLKTEVGKTVLLHTQEFSRSRRPRRRPKSCWPPITSWTSASSCKYVVDFINNEGQIIVWWSLLLSSYESYYQYDDNYKGYQYHNNFNNEVCLLNRHRWHLPTTDTLNNEKLHICHQSIQWTLNYDIDH